VTAVIEEATVVEYTGTLEFQGRTDVVRWNKDDDAQVQAAAEAFQKELATTRGAAYNDRDEVVREFDPEASHLRTILQLQAG
jgi:hypothetical protein